MVTDVKARIFFCALIFNSFSLDGYLFQRNIVKLNRVRTSKYAVDRELQRESNYDLFYYLYVVLQIEEQIIFFTHRQVTSTLPVS